MPKFDSELLAKAKSLGFSDRQIANLSGKTEDEIRALRKTLGLVPSYRLVDTCAAEFEAYTPYYYSTYDRGDDEVQPSDKRKIMILGGGPNRIGKGIQFDYFCVHAAFALKGHGFETLMLDSNLVRPSFVLGGRAMQIFYSDAELQHYMRFAVEASPERPVLVDKFLEDATEVDVDCIADVGHFEKWDRASSLSANSKDRLEARPTIVIGGMLEHIEFAGV